MHFCFLFFYLVFFHGCSKFTGHISLTPLCHFHPFHRDLDISWAITAESSPLHIASSPTLTKNLLFLSPSHYPRIYAPLRPLLLPFVSQKYEGTVTNCVILFFLPGVLILIVENKKKKHSFLQCINFANLSSIINYCEIAKPENSG